MPRDPVQHLSWILDPPLAKLMRKNAKQQWRASPSSEMAATDDPCRTRSSGSSGKKLANGQNTRPAGQVTLDQLIKFLRLQYFPKTQKSIWPIHPRLLVSNRYFSSFVIPEMFSNQIVLIRIVKEDFSDFLWLL